jgi:microcystin-dependent protein
MAFGGNISPAAVPGKPGAPPAATILETWGWMICDGSLLTPGEYPYLYAAIGTLYNQAGDPGTSFRLPDFRGYFLRMADMGRGIDPDTSIRTLANGSSNAGVGSSQAYALQTHMHIYNDPAAPAPPPPVAKAGTDVVIIGPQLTGAPTNSLTTPPGAVGNVNISTGETRPVNMYVYYIIRFR